MCQLCNLMPKSLDRIMWVLLKDITGHTLKGDYYINRIKKAGEITPEGVATTYQELRKQIGLSITNYGALPPLQATSAQLSVAA